MNLLFDLLHPADVNLFKNSVYKLKEEGATVFLAYRERGALERIARSEFPAFEIARLGTHRKRLAGKIFSILQREIMAYRFLRKNKIGVLVCQGLACGIACKLLGVKIIHYDDDKEYLLTFLLGKWFSDIDIVPYFMKVTGNKFHRYKGYKELAYLHPDYFSPVEYSLTFYGLTPFNYIFIREISNISVNYKNRKEILTEIINYLNTKGIKVLLSIEDKSLIPEFDNKCIILKEPVINLFSLIYYSRFLISSGDTMAREASLLGTPCIYTGGRVMNANKFFIHKGVLIQADIISEVLKTIDLLLDTAVYKTTKLLMKDLVINEFEDTNSVLLSQIRKFNK